MEARKLMMVTIVALGLTSGALSHAATTGGPGMIAGIAWGSGGETGSLIQLPGNGNEPQQLVMSGAPISGAGSVILANPAGQTTYAYMAPAAGTAPNSIDTSNAPSLYGGSDSDMYAGGSIATGIGANIHQRSAD